MLKNSSNAQGWGKQRRRLMQPLDAHTSKRCGRGELALPQPAFALNERRQWRNNLLWSERTTGADREAESLSPSRGAICRRLQKLPACNRWNTGAATRARFAQKYRPFPPLNEGRMPCRPKRPKARRECPDL